MIVYCDSNECKHNKEGLCTNKFDYGIEAIGIETNWMGFPVCSDYEPDKEESDL